MQRRLFLLLLLFSCSSPDEGATVRADVATRERFEVVSDALVYECGTLDCHGNTFRNLRLYGYGGLRLQPGGTPDRGFPLRSEAEVRANYDALAGLEPTLFAQVVGAEGGRSPERLALVAKARALQNHKGGPAVEAGDLADKCLISWLQSNVDEASCRQVLPDALRPPP